MANATHTISVQGERYETPEALQEAIAKLSGQLLSMPDGSPQRQSLAGHIASLIAALPDGYEIPYPEPPTDETHETEPEPEPSTEPEPEEEEADEEEETVQGAVWDCPTCGAPWPFPDAPPADPNAKQCPDCYGWGIVATGSRVEGHTTRSCPLCLGNGYVQIQNVTPQVAPPTAASTPEFPGALWNNETGQWTPPPGTEPPWSGAVWDGFYGRWT